MIAMWPLWLFVALTVAYAVAVILPIERQNKQAAADYRRRMDDRLRRLASGECPPPLNGRQRR